MTYNEFKDIITAEFGEIDAKVLERFEALDALYRNWNSRINVISRKDIDELYSHHVLHSLCIAAYCVKQRGGLLSPGSKVLDLGTGGGFPGIPLAIFFPEVQFTLCDSIGKKIKVASGVAEALGLENVVCVNARAESLPERYDWVVSRAVTSLDNFLPWVKGRYDKGVLYLKGGDIESELALAGSRCGLKRSAVKLWQIGNWLKDEWFEGKFVVEIWK